MTQKLNEIEIFEQKLLEFKKVYDKLTILERKKKLEELKEEIDSIILRSSFYKDKPLFKELLNKLSLLPTN